MKIEKLISKIDKNDLKEMGYTLSYIHNKKDNWQQRLIINEEIIDGEKLILEKIKDILVEISLSLKPLIMNYIPSSITTSLLLKVNKKLNENKKLNRTSIEDIKAKGFSNLFEPNDYQIPLENFKPYHQISFIDNGCNSIINNITDENVKNFMNRYKSYYQRIFNYTTSKIIRNPNVSIEDDIEKLSSLSSSLTILSKLNLNGKNIMIKDYQPEINFYLKIKKDKSYTIIELEEKLINQLIEYINKELETKNNLYITFIISSISSITDKNNITIKLTSNCSVE